MAGLPVPGSELTGDPSGSTGRSAEATIAAAIPPPVLEVLDTLWSNGRAAYVVGGSLRDALLGRPAQDWDMASDARPERLLELLHDAVYENQFGTVAIRRGGDVYEITTFRSDHDYADFRRPHRVEFGDTIELDLARRDLTCNAIAWGARAGAAPAVVDPYGGVADTLAHVLRAVGDPRKRFEEDALRMVRTVRLAAVLGFDVEAATLAGIQARAELVRHLSGERIATELDKLLAAEQPSVGLRLLADTDLLAGISPELAAQRGIAQNKIDGEDLWDHTLRSVDAAPRGHPVVRLAALVHDIGKPATLADGHFIGHDTVGADLADALLERLRAPRASRERVVHLVRNHMFSYEIHWSSAAVRRFIAKIGPDAIDELFALREADNIGSGLPPNAGRLDELRRRVDDAMREGVALDRGDLVVDGNDLMTEFGLPPGPRLGRILDALLDRVQDDPSLNDRPSLLLLAQGMLGDESLIEILLQAERALEMGRIDAAETLYRQVAEADPRNSIAVVGLARVTLERGDELGAYLQARRALAIDPENAAAGRMVQRLEEVMRYRGDPVPEPYAGPESAPMAEPAPAPALEPAPSPTDAAPALEVTATSGSAPEPEPSSEVLVPKATPVARRSFIRRILDRIPRR